MAFVQKKLLKNLSKCTSFSSKTAEVIVDVVLLPLDLILGEEKHREKERRKKQKKDLGIKKYNL